MSTVKEQNQSREDWLASLQEGDIVAYKKGSYSFNYYALDKIAKITKTRRFKLMNLDGVAFSSNGVEMGSRDTWSLLKKIEPVTQEVLDDIERRKILDVISKVNFKEKSLEFLKDIYAVIEKEKKEMAETEERS